MNPAANFYADKRARNIVNNDVDALDAIEKVAEERINEGSIVSDEDGN